MKFPPMHENSWDCDLELETNDRFLAIERHNSKQLLPLLRYQIHVFLNDKKANTQKGSFRNAFHKLIFSLYFIIIQVSFFLTVYR